MSPLSAQERLARQMVRNRAARAQETPSKRAQRLATQKAWDQKRRATETAKQRAERLAANNQGKREWYASLTAAQRQSLHKKKHHALQQKKATETQADRKQRLKQQRQYAQASRQNRTKRSIARNAIKDREYRATNRIALQSKRRQRVQASPSLKIKSNLRARIWKSIKAYGGKKSCSTEQLIGTTTDQFMAWISSQFSENMNWTNYGQWHIDHIIPCAAFDLTKRAQQLVAFNYQNLRPLWASANIRKGKRVPVTRPKNGWTIKSVRAARRALSASNRGPQSKSR